MNRIFTAAAIDRLPIGGGGRGEITFKVTNSSAHTLRGQLHLILLGSTKGEWLNIAGVEFRLLKGIQGQVINIPKGAYNKYTTPSCNRVWWDNLTFASRGTRLWESVNGHWGSDNQCDSSSPYVVTGDR